MSYSSIGVIDSDNDMSITGFMGYQILFIDATNNNINIILPLNSNLGASYLFIRIDNSTNIVTFSCQIGDTINNNSSLTYPVKTQSQVFYNNNNWLFPLVAFN